MIIFFFKKIQDKLSLHEMTQYSNLGVETDGNHSKDQYHWRIFYCLYKQEILEQMKKCFIC